MVIDGGPRKNMNTAALMDAFTDGVAEANPDIEVKRVRLYDTDFRGCMACYGCKLKGRESIVCRFRDNITPILEECNEADGLVFSSPIYFGQPTGRLREFMERLWFPRLSYNDYSSLAPRVVPTATIYAMTGSGEAVDIYVAPYMDYFDGLVESYFGKPERIITTGTFQVKDYSKYEMAAFDLDDKRKWHEEQYPKDLEHARDAGRRMAEKIQGR